MRKLIYLFLIWGLAVNAQGKMSDIQYSSTPAATIIGTQNKEVNTIHNYEVLYTELISPIVSTENNLPTNLNVEFAPFFLKSRNITLTELNTLSNFHKRARISISTAKVAVDSVSSFSRAGIGLRFNVIHPQYTVLAPFNDLLTIVDRLDLTTVTGIPDAALFPGGNLDFAVLFAGINDAPVKQKVIEIFAKINTGAVADRQTLKTKVEEYRDAYEFEGSENGFSMDVAGSFALDFPDNTISYSRINRWGAWLNASYKMKYLSVAGIGRFSNYSFDPDIIFDSVTFVDLGINVSFDIKKLKLSAEYIGKIATSDTKFADSADTIENVTEHKWDASLSYQITDNYLISLSYSEAKGNNDYFKEKTNQLLVGLSAAIFSFKQ